MLSGNYDGRGTVLINEHGTAYCKGDQPKHCVPLTGVESGRTMAVNDAQGRTVLLQYEGAFGQVCSVNSRGFRTALDCKALDFTKLADYKATVAGRGMVVDAIDGKYLCTEASGSPHCLRFMNADGTPIERKKPKLPDWRMKPASHIQFEIEEDGRVSSWEGFMYGEMDRDCYSAGPCESDNWFSDRWSWFPPGPEREKCLKDCQDKADATDRICGIAALIGCVGGSVRGGVAGCAGGAAAVGAACMGGNGIGYLICRSDCYN